MGWSQKAGKQGADVGTQLQYQEEVPLNAGNPETARETHQTPQGPTVVVLGVYFPTGWSC